jgi:hypothetical protein
VSTPSAASATPDLGLTSPDPSPETPAVPDEDDDIEDLGDGIPFEDALDDIPELALPTHLCEDRRDDVKDLLGGFSCMSKTHLRGGVRRRTLVMNLA